MKDSDCRVNERKWRCKLSIWNDDFLVTCEEGCPNWFIYLMMYTFFSTGRNFAFESSVCESNTEDVEIAFAAERCLIFKSPVPIWTNCLRAYNKL